MALQFGRNAFLNISDTAESTYGDGGSSFTIYNRIFSCTLKKVEERVQTAKLTTTDGGFARGQFKVSTQVSGTIEIPLQYEGVGIWLKNALGSATTYTSTGSAPYEHTYKADTTDLPTFGIKFQRGSGDMEYFKGMMISSMTLSVTAGEEAKLSCDMIGQDSAARAGSITATYGDGEQAYHYPAVQFNFNSVNYDLYSFELTIDNKLEERRTLGSTLTASPDVNDIREVTITVTCGLDDNNLYNAQLAGTTSNCTLTFTDGADSIAITLYNAVVMDYSDEVTTAGRLERTATFKGFSSAANEAVEIKITNQDSSAVGN